MSNAVFPALLGQDWSGTKSPIFSTKVQQALSGKELRLAHMIYPLWKFSVGYEVLRSDTRQDFQTLIGFFLARQGMFDSFLYTDPNDNAVTAQGFGVGDNITTSFQLLKAYGGYVEPVQNVNGTPQIFVNDWEGNQLQYATPRTNNTLQTEDFSTSWAILSGTITANTGTSPRGDATVDRFLEAAATAEHFVEQTIPAYANSTVVILNVYASPQNGRNFLRLSVVQRDNLTVLGAGFNLTTGAIVSPSAGVTAFTPQLMANGQYRCSIMVSVGTGGTSPRQRIQSTTDGSTLVYLGDITKGTNIWGANSLDATSLIVPSSYIASTTAATTVTDYTLGATGIVALFPAPLVAANLTWTGSFYYRCRFTQDQVDFNEFVNNFWNLKKVEFQSIKL